MQKDPYRVLQVASHAEPEVIEGAYRRLARKYHPDASSSFDAQTRMKDINWAYEILKDPQKREDYDKSRQPSQSSVDSHPTPPHTPRPPMGSTVDYRTRTPSTATSSQASVCQNCLTPGSTRYVEFCQNIGMLIMRSHRHIKGNLCKTCINDFFYEFTGKTMVLGWWGVISFILTPFILLNNFIR